MKKFAFLFIIFFLNISIPIHAEESNPYNNSSNEINYEMSIIQLYDKSISSTFVSEKEIEILVTYSETINPPKTYYYSMTENNVTYSGTLYLYKVHSTNGKTYAYYRGTLYSSE